MTLEELKILMGIAADDTSKDATLKLYLEMALDAAKSYANAYDWTSTGALPAGLQLGIVRFVELSQSRKTSTGVISESIGGMSRTYANVANNDADYFSEVYSMWNPFKRRGVVFRSAKRRGANNIDHLIPDDITITGTRKL